MMRRHLLTMTAALFVLGLAAQNAAATPAAPPSAVMAPIQALIRAVNSGNAASARGLFTADGVVVDEFPPYKWNGASAGSAWISTLEATAKAAHWTGLRGIPHAVKFFDLSPGAAYVVVPTTVMATINGKAGAEQGTWTFTLRKAGAGWLISSVAWGTVSK